ncbi:hypothetical protein L3Q82_015112, partial [Scortum barcoo]
MVTVMTPWSFHRILMGSSGSRCTKRWRSIESGTTRMRNSPERYSR